jgi:hypothetical protein
MTARPLLLCVAISLLACACSVPPHQAQTSAPQASDFEATIARIGRTDPGSPAVLSAQLADAEFLLSGALGPCAERLERVQEQLGSVDANPKARVMFPDGWARATDLEYRLHLARAACGSQTDRENELRTAAWAARRAVELYRNAFDYRSMAIMQFDVGIVLHQLGEKAAALAALATALDMDREYGFQDDARENYKLVLTWRGETADDAYITGLMQDFPQRRAVLQFGWHPSDARITFESHRERLEDDQIVASRAAASFERRVGPDSDGGWSVSYTHRLTGYEPGVWPTLQGSQTPQTTFLPALLSAVGFKVSTTGEFEGVTDSTAFAARLAAKTEKLIRAAAPSGDRARSLMNAALEATADTFSPGLLEAATAENYQLETAMWIGATLEQGVWYEISAPLSLPGIPRVVVQHRIQFAFTRIVPCTASVAAQTCVEMVIRATPDEEALDQVIADGGLTAYTASTEARIVTDAATLVPYTREERIYWYASLGKARRDSVLMSEHLVSTTSYVEE